MLLLREKTLDGIELQIRQSVFREENALKISRFVLIDKLRKNTEFVHLVAAVILRKDNLTNFCRDHQL